MRGRSQAREFALQMLYQLDLRRGADARQILDEFWQEQRAPEEIKAYANQLFSGTAEALPSIDPMIAGFANNWDMKRMAVIDRNILRLGAYELLHVAEVPPKVCLNEAIELAKRYGDAESSKFINGILDTIHKTHARPAVS
ncbi:MAG: transcription antitermination factor NusB [Candidatus Omnitrophica bacterium]|nr:transcription antitermination factor NusB [Candidatus Omnitrophota bacterium]